MRIGVVSDTHNNLPNVRQIVRLFNDAKVNRVVHTGDITQATTLEVFAQLRCPLYGVFGNNDVGEKPALKAVIQKFGFIFVDPPLEVYWCNQQIVVVHDPLEFEGVLSDKHDLALHGHTHMQHIEYQNGRLIFNPGECAGHMKGLNAIGVVDLATMTPNILNF